MSKLFTKSIFKIALDCPRRMYYERNKELYANQQNEDDFLMALAEGGFQVGSLAKIYYQVLDENDIKESGYDAPVKRTLELLQQENVTIAEAAFRFGSCFVRVDILEKKGNVINIIEVKAKSWNSEEQSFLDKKGKKVSPGIRPYIYDIAFQKYVVENSLNKLYPTAKYHYESFLMMADKTKFADVAGINQMFRIGKNDLGRSFVKVSADALEKLNNGKVQILTAFNTTDICNDIIQGNTEEQDEYMGMKFQEFVNKMSDLFINDKKAEINLSTACFKCPYDTDGSESGLLSGYRECWKDKAQFTDADFEKPLLKDLWGAGNTKKKGELFSLEKYFLNEITESDLSVTTDEPGLHHSQRKWLQIGLATNNKEILQQFEADLKGDTYLDRDGLQKEMGTWKYPLHFIDFETTAVALPFYVNMRPYEQVAFQFSHHILHEDGKVEHFGQHLNTKKGHFPNFEFVRELKNQLETDNGSIFRYSNHENTILNAIYKQLEESTEPDKDDLMRFIGTVTKEGEREMIDLWAVVKLYYYHKSMKGSNSIKAVLPAVLNSSDFLKKKYSKPVYGKDILSQNIGAGKLINDPVVWITYDKSNPAVVVNPYHLLPDMETLSEEVFESMEINNGGAALMAYNKMQFAETTEAECNYLQNSLLRYCELDTLAMVFIVEYFRDALKNG